MIAKSSRCKDQKPWRLLKQRKTIAKGIHRNSHAQNSSNGKKSGHKIQTPKEVGEEDEIVHHIKLSQLTLASFSIVGKYLDDEIAIIWFLYLYCFFFLFVNECAVHTHISFLIVNCLMAYSEAIKHMKNGKKLAENEANEREWDRRYGR